MNAYNTSEGSEANSQRDFHETAPAPAPQYEGEDEAAFFYLELGGEG